MSEKSTLPPTARQRAWRIVGGVAITLVGFFLYSLSRRLDPQNRAAIVAIAVIIFGINMFASGLRRGPRPDAEARRAPTGPPVSTDLAFTAAALGWLVPGLGHWILGRRQKAILFFSVITITFLVGLLLAQGRNMSWDRDRIYFLAYMFNPVESGLAVLATSGLEMDRAISTLDVGFLYGAVACLLNLVAVIDIVEIGARHRPTEEAETPDEVEPETTEAVNAT